MSDVVNLLGPGILLAAPILYAALGGLFTQRAGIFNIALEGFMLLAAYFSIAIAVRTGSLIWGTVAGVAAAALAATVMAVIVVAFRADEVIVGIAVNVFALGLTTFLLADARDAGRELELATGYPQLHLPLLADVPVLGPIFDRRDLLVWLLIPAAAGVMYIFRRTMFGLQLKAAGEAPLAARAAGVRVTGVRFASIVISGAFCGIAGAQLAIGSVHLFSENMTSGRGIIAFAAVIFGAGFVSRTATACLLFGIAQALAGLLQIRTSFPSQFMLMVPYVLTIIAITSSDALRRRRIRRPEPDAAPSEPQDAVPAGIVVAGHLTIDEIRFDDGNLLPATTGGAAAYAALGAFLAQGDIAVVARVGQDYPMGQLQLSHTDGGRVRTEAVTVLPGRSIHNIARYRADGARAFDIESFDTLVELTPQPADVADLDLKGRWVLVAPTTLPQQRDLITTLKAAGALVALDTELHYLTDDDALERLRELTRAVDCFLPSREHIQHLFDRDSTDIADMKPLVDSFGCALTIVKCGREGVVVFGADTPQGLVVPAVPDLDVVDPTGAGDGFNGGLLVGLARGDQPATAAVAGCVSASFVIQAVGAKVPDIFSGAERAARYRQCSASSTINTEREELVQHRSR
ncbi:PfkB family carbohydrate kinase [Dactylosporangium sp. NPDC048998]|uniref:PfkB family carbohydrate kinase n=1 Tax=Dactylosporangium sp. NPDC048998 TaxID=3363976 RepID=UPI00371EDA8A